MDDIKKAVKKSLKKANVPEVLSIKILLNLPKGANTDEIRNFVIGELKKTNSAGIDSILERFDEIFDIEIKKL